VAGSRPPASAAEHWQIGDSGSGREFYLRLLDGIASADPE